MATVLAMALGFFGVIMMCIVVGRYVHHAQLVDDGYLQARNPSLIDSIVMVALAMCCFVGALLVMHS